MIPFGVIQSGAEGDSPAPSCSITLEAPGLTGAFGYSAAQIDAQRVFIENISQDGGTFGASTDTDNPTPIWQSGVRWIEARNASRSDSANNGIDMFLSAPDGSRSVQLRCAAGTSSWDLATNLAGTDQTVQDLAIAFPQAIAIGIDGSTGDIKAWGPGGEIVLPSAFSGFWGSESVVVVGGVRTSVSGTSGEVTIGTAAPYDTSPTGQNYCGDDL